MGFLLTYLSISSMSHAQEKKVFYFYFQNVFGSGVTLNKVEQIFGDFSSAIHTTSQFSSGTTIKEISESIENDTIDLLLWGYSDRLNEFMTSKGFQQLLISPLDVHVYQFGQDPTPKDQVIRIGLLADSAAYYTAKHYYKTQQQKVEFITFTDYFTLIQSCFRQEIDQVIAVNTFSISQPGSIKPKFRRIASLPPIASLSIWVKTQDESIRNIIFDYFQTKEAIMSEVVGTGKILRVSK